MADMPVENNRADSPPSSAGQLALDHFLARISVTTVFLARLLLLEKIDHGLRRCESIRRCTNNRVGNRVAEFLAILAAVNRHGRQAGPPSTERGPVEEPVASAACAGACLAIRRSPTQRMSVGARHRRRGISSTNKKTASPPYGGRGIRRVKSWIAVAPNRRATLWRWLFSSSWLQAARKSRAFDCNATPYSEQVETPAFAPACPVGLSRL